MLILLCSALAHSLTFAVALEGSQVSPAAGPLRPHPDNTRNFADNSGRVTTKTGSHTWQRWEQGLTSTRSYNNPYADVSLRVTYTGPDKRTIRSHGFWDAGDIFRIRCAFPVPGTWQWQTECSDASNTCLFARNIVARLFGNFVVFSPSFDSAFLPLANEVGRATRDATVVHLVTQHLHDFLAGIEWWRLEPAHNLIGNQPGDVTRRMVLAKSATGDLAVGYLPDNEAIEVSVSAFPAPIVARWFNPMSGRFTDIPGLIDNNGTHRFAPPARGDWVLLLRKNSN